MREDEEPTKNDRRPFATIRRLAADDRYLLPAVFVVACVVVVSRRPDAITHAQFFAEDGAWWYSQAHDRGGLNALFIPYRSYLHLVPRLSAWLALAVPLAQAPLVMNAVAITIQAVPAAFVCSRRMSAAIPSLWLRLAIALLYVAMPNIWGTMANVTNSQWHLAVLSGLIVVSTPDPRAAWRAFDVVALILSGLSGPSSIFLLLIIAIKWSIRRERWLLTLGAITAATAAVQAGAILFAPEQAGVRPQLGASLDALLRVVVGRIVYAGLFGQTGYEQIVSDPNTLWLRPLVLGLFGLGLLAAVAFTLLKGPLELRLFLVYAILILTAALAWPPVTPMEQSFWQTLADPAASNRYFLIPVFALILLVLWLTLQPARIPRGVGAVLLAVLIIFGVVRDWREPPAKDYDFARFVAKYEQARPGDKVQILYPPGWSMVLTKP